MQNRSTPALSHTLIAGPSMVGTDRRNRRRLRDLCDEVLASFRAASDTDLFSEQDRTEGRALLARIAGR